ncbi:MAG: prolipoprotein diacylglyceryl transferase [Myxococcales bacterium]|nr:prolipoprotein diacylglyceryl transferase [Myxococcales bacterium]
MHPILLEDTWIGDLHGYGTMVLLGGLCLAPGLWWDAKRRGMPGELLLDFYIVLVVGCFVGGRLLDVLSRPAVFLAEPMRIFSGQENFVFYGSLFGVLLGFVWLARRYRRPVADVADLLAPWIGVGHGVARVGCYFAGCCFGAPVVGDPAWALHFPPGSIAFDGGEVAHAGAHTVGLFPVQLAEVVGLEVIGLALVATRVLRGVESRWRMSARYALLYGCLRMVTELFRGDHSRNHLFTVEFPGLADLLRLPADQPFLLSTSQLVSLALIGWGAAVIIRTRRAEHALSSADRRP